MVGIEGDWREVLLGAKVCVSWETASRDGDADGLGPGERDGDGDDGWALPEIAKAVWHDYM